MKKYLLTLTAIATLSTSHYSFSQGNQNNDSSGLGAVVALMTAVTVSYFGYKYLTSTSTDSTNSSIEQPKQGPTVTEIAVGNSHDNRLPQFRGHQLNKHHHDLPTNAELQQILSHVSENIQKAHGDNEPTLWQHLKKSVKKNVSSDELIEQCCWNQ